jgi:hypothetical protein
MLSDLFHDDDDDAGGGAESKYDGPAKPKVFSFDKLFHGSNLSSCIRFQSHQEREGKAGL